ncbi:MAG: adenylyl-sulfate kinase [Anaerolineaceae bacterium]|nr:adenylyl-sulfate kinase [Anaerolineaceae bacterium]
MADFTTTSLEKMSVVFVGHVDHGKSTVIGRLLADTDSLPHGKLEQVRLECKRNASPFEYAYLIDALKDERAQSITIDAARVFFKSEKRNYIIIDAPGHIEFIRNMVTGASRAEAAILVIDAHEGVMENSRRHGYLLWMLGIKQIVVLVNKMDLVDYRQDVFESVTKEYSAFLSEIGMQPLGYIPVSGKEGDNISSPSKNMAWYQGDTVLTALDRFQKAPSLEDKPFRMPVQDVYKFTSFDDDRRIVAGTIISGRMKIGDEVIFYPSTKRSQVKTIESFAAPQTDSAISGQAAGFILNEQIYIQRGEVAALAHEPPPQVSSRLRVSLFWLGKKPMLPKKQYVLKLGMARVKVQIEQILRVIDASDVAVSVQKNKIELHDVAECILSLHWAIAFDLSESLTDTGRFVIVDDYEICGGGIVLEALTDEQEWARQEKMLRDSKWIKSDVSIQQRAERYNQRPTLVIITGCQGVGRKRIARAFEKRLFAEGKFVYYFGMGSVVYGVNLDIKQKGNGEYRQEHIRRLAELANIMLDAGLITIVTAVKLTRLELNLIKTIIDPSRIETVWVGDQYSTDVPVDLQLPENEQTESAVVLLKQLLQEHSVIFRP